METHRWVIDSIEEFVASVEVDAATMIHVPLWLLPDRAREGQVLLVQHDRPSGGTRSQLTVEVDDAATRQAMDASAAQTEAGRKAGGDAGGDVRL
jgi:hypothetical protein